MHPYREIGIIQPISKAKKRWLFKTWYYKILIKLRGRWNERFERCPECLFVIARPDGINMLFHSLEHRAAEYRRLKVKNNASLS
jgi:hypothetical protein